MRFLECLRPVVNAMIDIVINDGGYITSIDSLSFIVIAIYTYSFIFVVSIMCCTAHAYIVYSVYS